MKHLKEFIERFSGRDVFTFRDAEIFLKKNGVSGAYLNLLIHNLLKKGKLKRISKGHYTFKDDIIVAGKAFAPYYYGLHFALSISGLWQQASNPVIITAKKIRTGVREIMGGNVVLRRISPKMAFGVEDRQIDGYWVKVSGPEKTLIDFAYFNQKMPEECVQGLLGKISAEKLEALLKKTPEKTRQKIRKMLGRHGRKKLGD